jgi:hypothetical protein
MKLDEIKEAFEILSTSKTEVKIAITPRFARACTLK